MSRSLRAFALFAIALVSASGAVVSNPSPPRAAAATAPAGNDFSWPQCPKGVGDGQGKPLPSGSRRFEIVGLTNGVGFHENPCLASEWRYARGHASYVTAYTMLTYPTASQLKASATGHYGTCSTLACRLQNNGWAQGAFADASLDRIGGHPPMVWVDVEPRPQQPWSSNTSRNSLVVKAAISSLQHHGYRVGIYSVSSLWREVAGYSTRLPEWVPAGSLTAGCGRPFSAGPVWISQWAHYYSSGDGYDENGLCGSAPSLSSVYQPAHPTVSTSRNSTTAKAFARYTDGHAFDLGMKVVRRPAVVRVNSSDGVVPLFVAVSTEHRLFARTLASRWVRVGAGSCSGTPGVAVRGATAWVGCRAAGAVLSLTRLSLDTHGAPTSSTTTSYDGALSASPAVTLASGGVPVATATFTDGTVQSRTPSTTWTTCPSGTSVSVPTWTRL
ncbi:MAG TPA: hypothetical protein VFH66_13065 [Mycobacteriales bacterium]|nr:hypothetical protein [Mycobacteriales bacterium]